MKKQIRVFIGILLIIFLLSGGDTGAGSQRAANAAAIPSGVYWTTYSNIPNKPDSPTAIVQEGPYYLHRVEIGEPSTAELLASVEFANDNVHCLTYTNPNDHAQYWVERIVNEKGETTAIKVASTAANNWYLRISINAVSDQMPAMNGFLPRPDNGVRSPDGETLSDPYADPKRPIAGFKELNFKGSYEDGNKIRSSLEEAGYEPAFRSYSNGVYTVATLKELVSRAKIEETVLKPKDWKTDKNKTKGNVGFYNNKPSSFTGKISIDWTLSNIPFTIVINDVRLDMLEDEEDRTSYTMSGTAEIKQKSFTITDNDGKNALVFKLKDKQQKRFSEEHAFQVSKTPKPGVSWDYIETWEYVEAQYNTPFLLTVSYTTRQSPTDFSFIPVSGLDKLDGSHAMTFMMPAFGGTATWSFREE